MFIDVNGPDAHGPLWNSVGLVWEVREARELHITIPASHHSIIPGSFIFYTS